MHVHIIYAHPEEKSFTHALLEQTIAAIGENGHSFEISDLYRENFNPVAGRGDFTSIANPDYFHYQSEQAYAANNQTFSPEIAREQARFQKADLVIFIFPLWWGGPPAILKGWFDRVLSFGFAYADGTRFETGLFKGKRAMACITTGGTQKRFSQNDAYGTIKQVLWPMQHCQLEYLGFETLEPFVAYAAPRVSELERAQYLADWHNRLKSILNAE